MKEGDLARFVKDTPKMQVAVWFDRAHDHICVADRLKAAEGGIIPEENIIRIALEDGEDFFEAVFNAAKCGDEFWKVMDGIQAQLDRKAMHAINLSERLRLERSKQADGVIDRNKNEVIVKADEYGKLHELRKRLAELFSRVKETAATGIPKFEMREFDSLSRWMQENELDGPR
jgi:hypothetical protein